MPFWHLLLYVQVCLVYPRKLVIILQITAFPSPRRRFYSQRAPWAHGGEWCTLAIKLAEFNLVKKWGEFISDPLKTPNKMLLQCNSLLCKLCNGSSICKIWTVLKHLLNNRYSMKVVLMARWLVKIVIKWLLTAYQEHTT